MRRPTCLDIREPRSCQLGAFMFRVHEPPRAREASRLRRVFKRARGHARATDGVRREERRRSSAATKTSAVPGRYTYSRGHEGSRFGPRRSAAWGGVFVAGRGGGGTKARDAGEASPFRGVQTMRIALRKHRMLPASFDFLLSEAPRNVR